MASNTGAIVAQSFQALVTYPVSEQVIADLKAKAALMDCDTPERYEDTRMTIGVIRDTRVAIEKRRVELKADALAYGRMVDSEAKRFTVALEAIEAPLKAMKFAVDDAEAKVKREAEAAKLAALEAEIAANKARQEAEEKAKRDAEEARIAADRKALEDERATLAAERAIVEAKQRAEQERLDAQRREEQTRLDAERLRLETDRRAEDARQRVAREQIETERRAVQAEQDRQARIEFERHATIQAEQEATKRLEQERVEKTRVDAEREAMRPDVEKARQFIIAIRAMTPPVVTAATLREVLRIAAANLGKVASLLEQNLATTAGNHV